MHTMHRNFIHIFVTGDLYQECSSKVQQADVNQSRCNLAHCLLPGQHLYVLYNYGTLLAK